MDCGASFSTIAAKSTVGIISAQSAIYGTASPQYRVVVTHPRKMDKPSELTNDIVKWTKLYSWRPSNDNIFLGRLPSQHDVRIFYFKLRRVHLRFRDMSLPLESCVINHLSDNGQDVGSFHADTMEF
jgi:hypothetical protein